MFCPRLYRRRGFTLIELLVVIAIIGILAAMVFPVFARARESARKAVCLSNVKNIGLAIQMYLGDNNDTLPPGEHQQAAIDYFATIPGGNSDHDVCDTAGQLANPYLRWPVLFDEYTKNREVWQCPSAKMVQGANFIVGDPNWLRWYQVNQGAWGESSGIDRLGPCFTAWPTGWGGEVTDSVLQQKLAVNQKESTTALKAFVQTIGTKETEDWDRKLSTVDDTAGYVMIGDSGAITYDNNPGTFAYPDICAIECGVSAWEWHDWVACASTAADCGLYNYAPDDGSFISDPNLRKPYSRHLGGVNIGFLDGHATWVNSDAFLAHIKDGTWKGVHGDGPNTLSCPCFFETYPGVPTLY